MTPTSDFLEEISLTDRLRPLAIPLLSIFGTEDQICDPEESQEAYGSDPGGADRGDRGRRPLAERREAGGDRGPDRGFAARRRSSEEPQLPARRSRRGSARRRRRSLRVSRRVNGEASRAPRARSSAASVHASADPAAASGPAISPATSAELASRQIAAARRRARAVSSTEVEVGEGCMRSVRPLSSPGVCGPRSISTASTATSASSSPWASS